ncbi:MAG TPA: HlyD family efflux transporter periplasmic adaptor subunit [Terriglobales bacterium]|nr:HlyD family efflux transporter periplasmic adaptor subunit [Terriglobales bacterium]
MLLAVSLFALTFCVAAVYSLRTNAAAARRVPNTVLAEARGVDARQEAEPVRMAQNTASLANSAPRAGSASGATKNGAVGCLGRIEPTDGVLKMTGGYLDGRPQRVSELDVKEGDQVRAGQLLVVLDGKDQLETAVHLADARVDLARTRLAQVKAGSRPSDIAAQKAQVAELKASLQNARTEYQRYQRLHEKTDVSAAELDSRRLAVETTEEKLHQAEEHLKSIAEVRQTDVDVAESELRVSQAEAAHARAQLKTAMVYAPANGRILKVHAYPGEEPGPDGLLDLGKTDVMYVEAEVYETDIARVRPGQRATITSDVFPSTLSGVVERVGYTLSKNTVLPLDPVAYADARVFKVRIRLDNGNEVAGLINSKVNVVIQP